MGYFRNICNSFELFNGLNQILAFWDKHGIRWFVLAGEDGSLHTSRSKWTARNEAHRGWSTCKGAAPGLL